MILGIDFGTCFSHVTVVLKNRELKDDLVKTDDGSIDIPSKYLYIDGEEYFGDSCEAPSKRNRYGKDIIEHFKLDILNGKSKNMIRNEVPVTYEDVLEKYLGYLINLTKNSIEQNGLDYDPECIVITVPSARSDYGGTSAAEYSAILKEVLSKLTGLKDDSIMILPEPTAAAYSYLTDNLNSFVGNQTFMIFDLGGGTADVAIVNHNSATGSSDVLADCGIPIGAHKWNCELAKMLRTSLSDPTISEDDIDVEKLKRDLTHTEEAWFAKGKEKCCVKRDLFNMNTADLRNQLMNVVDKAMKDADIDFFESIDKLILVGGGSNMPQIADEFISRYPGLTKKKITLYKPSVAISNGAALYAMEHNVHTAKPNKGQGFIRRASHSYGLEVYRDDDSKYTEVLNIIYKGEPFDQGRIYWESGFVLYPHEDNATTMLIEIFESDSTKKDCDQSGFLRNKIGVGAIPLRFEIPTSYIGHSKDYKPTIAITLESDGRVMVTLRDSSGSHENTQIVSFKGRDN